MDLVIIVRGIQEIAEGKTRRRNSIVAMALFNRPVSAKAEIKRFVCRNYTGRTEWNRGVMEGVRFERKREGNRRGYELHRKAEIDS